MTSRILLITVSLKIGMVEKLNSGCPVAADVRRGTSHGGLRPRYLGGCMRLRVLLARMLEPATLRHLSDKLEKAQRHECQRRQNNRLSWPGQTLEAFYEE